MSSCNSNRLLARKTARPQSARLIAVAIYIVMSLVFGGFAWAEDPGARFEVPIATQRDAQFNRVVSTGAGIASPTAARSRSIGAVANTISITQSGSGNTIILDAEQSNSGAVVAATSLNGTLQFD